jgi:Carboxylesterase family
MCKMWTNFGKFGDPTPNDTNPLPFKWKSIADNKDWDYLMIDDEDKMRMEMNLNEKRVEFWRGVYKKYNKAFVPSKL